MRSKRRSKFQSALDDIKRCHESLWPGTVVPRMERLDLQGDGSMHNLLPTSLLLASLTWAFTAPKRSPSSKRTAGELLGALLTYTCSSGQVSIKWSAVSPTGQRFPMQATVASTAVVPGLLHNDMSDAIALHWDGAFMEPEKLFPTSPRKSPSLVDFVLWSLDPLPVNNKDDELKRNKALLATEARPLLTQVAHNLDTAVVPEVLKREDAIRPFDVLHTTGAKRRRLTSLSVNSVAALAAQRLYTGKVRRLLSS